MTAKEKLTEKYKKVKDAEENKIKEASCGRMLTETVHIDYAGNIFLNPEDIDLVANLVVERIKEWIGSR